MKSCRHLSLKQMFLGNPKFQIVLLCFLILSLYNSQILPTAALSFTIQHLIWKTQLCHTQLILISFKQQIAPLWLCVTLGWHLQLRHCHFLFCLFPTLHHSLSLLPSSRADHHHPPRSQRHAGTQLSAEPIRHAPEQPHPKPL